MSSPDLDRSVRHLVYTSISSSGRAPSVVALAETLGETLGETKVEVAASLERLHGAHALVLEGATREVRMASPFSNVKTAYRVESSDRSWDANCAWDALAIVRLLGKKEARVVDLGGPGREGRELTIRAGSILPTDGVVSSAVMASHWWDDIVFT